MTNMFKNRFSSLLEDEKLPYREKIPYKKNTFNERKYDKPIKVKLNTLDNLQFPSLTLISNVKPISIDCKFIDKINSYNPTIKPELPMGWITLTRNNKNKCVINRRDRREVVLNNEESETLEILKIMDKLVLLHDTRRTDYINSWGEYEYEKTFLFPNYNYSDIEYEENMETYDTDDIDDTDEIN